VLRTLLKINVGENDTDDIRTTIMDPNTRTLIRVNIEDIENDMSIFQILRGGSPADSAARKQMMKDFHISRDYIDT
jgi:DNA gyrase/topoisomerase IV subunit B